MFGPNLGRHGPNSCRSSPNLGRFGVKPGRDRRCVARSRPDLARLRPIACAQGAALGIASIKHGPSTPGVGYRLVLSVWILVRKPILRGSPEPLLPGSAKATRDPHRVCRQTTSRKHQQSSIVGRNLGESGTEFGRCYPRRSLTLRPGLDKLPEKWPHPPSDRPTLCHRRKSWGRRRP